MKKQRIYLDTSVFGGLYDKEFQDYTEPLFERIKIWIWYNFLKYTEQELEYAPEKTRALTELLPINSIVYVKTDIEAAQLAKKYIEEGVVGPTSF